MLAALGVGIAAFWHSNPWLIPVALAPLLLINRSLVGAGPPAGGARRSEDGALQRPALRRRAGGGARRAQRFERPLSLMMPDLDLLRDVNNTGGTGVAPRDVTPEATASVLERPAPGIAEAIRADAIRRTPHGLLSRGLAGMVGHTLIVNLPGSPGGCRDGFAVLRPALGHALALLSEKTTTHSQT